MSVKSTVLVVDDDEGVRELIAFLLGRAGYRAVTANDGPEALDAMASARPDLVVATINGAPVRVRVCPGHALSCFVGGRAVASAAIVEAEEHRAAGQGDGD